MDSSRRVTLGVVAKKLRSSLENKTIRGMHSRYLILKLTSQPLLPP